MVSVRGRRIAWMRVVLGPAIGAVLAGAAVGACGAGSAPAGGARIDPAPLQTAYERAIKMVLPSVVEIDAGKSTGSGVVFDAKGDIVTNAHVVGTQQKFEVRVSALSNPLPARLVGEFTPDDLAVIRLTSRAKDLQPVRWANSAKVQNGDIVLAMGSPYGLIDSVTQGIVSATARTVTGSKISGRPPTVIVNAIQTSAAINPGNSGGALALLSGEVLGIPTLTARDPQLGGSGEGIGFAIPANIVRDIADQLIATGKVTKSDRASLEITGETHTDSSGSADGVTVTAIPHGAAAAAGIVRGDVIVGVGGQQTPSLAELENELIQYRPGDKVKVEILRHGNPRQVTVTLGTLKS
jgi:putative serine protease PepD